MTTENDMPNIKKILEFSGDGEGLNAKYNRIILQGLTDKVHALSEHVYKAHQGIKEKTDEISGKYEATSKKQAKIQNQLQIMIVLLTLVIAISTAFYTWITWESVSTMRDANEIQRQFLDIEKTKQKHNRP